MYKHLILSRAKRKGERSAKRSAAPVSSLPSQGRMTGETAVAVKKSVILRCLVMRKSRHMPLPGKNARNRNKGKRMEKECHRWARVLSVR
jgi:hypothetical protein